MRNMRVMLSGFGKVMGQKGALRLVTLALVAACVAAPLLQTAQVNAAPQAQSGSTTQGVVRPSGADLYDLPDGTVTATLAPVDFVTIFGRDTTGEWLVVSTSDGQTGWVKTAQVIAYNVQSLPVMTGEGAGASPTVAATTAATTVAQPTQPPTATSTPTQPPTPTYTPTPMPPTATPTPTNTPTPMPPTATPTLAPTIAPTRSPSLPAASNGAPRRSIVGVVNVRGVTTGSAPGLDNGDTLPAGATITLVARNEAGDWVQGTQNNGPAVWLPVSEIVAFGVNGLPVAGASVDGTTVDSTSVDSASVDSTSVISASVDSTSVVSTSVESTSTGSPATDAPTTDAPTTDAPSTDTPTTDTPSADTPSADTPSTDAPNRQNTESLASVLMTGSRLNIRSGPGTEYTIVGHGLPDEDLALLGSNEVGDWLLVRQLGTEGATGWVSANFVETTSDIATLPVVDPAGVVVSAPILLPTPTAAAPSTAAPSTAAPSTDAPATDAPATDAPTTAVPSPASITRTSPTGLSGNIVFQDGENGIWLYNLDAAELRRLTSGYDPSFSPDGRTVTFVKGDGGNNGIYTINIDGSDERKIWGEGEILRSPKYSPDGEHIIHSRLIGEYKCFDTEFFGCISLAQLIAWFPEAAIPAVSRAILGNAPRLSFPNWGISRIANTGGDFRDIAALDSSVAPDWNSDGIVYQSKAGLEITTDTPTGETRKVFNGNWDWDPDWQPNGGFILYQSKEGSHWEIWRVTPDGGGIAALTRPETTLVDVMPSNVAPAWSFDGERIVYASNRDADEEAGAWRLWTMNADGSDKRPLPIDVPINYSFAAEQVADWGRPVE